MKDKQKIRKRFLALLLSLAMVITYMPTYMLAYAESDEDQPVVTEEAAAEESAVQEKAEEAVEEPAKDAETPGEVVEEPAEDAETPDEVVESSDESANDAKAEEKAESKAEDKKTIDYTKELDTVAVKVTAPEDAFSEDVELVVKQLDKDKKEDKEAFEEAEEALAENKQTYDGILAFDIHFENSKGEEVEPDGVVSVEMTAKKAAFKGVDPGTIDTTSVQVTHIGDETEVVADNMDKDVEGTIAVKTKDNAVEKVDAEFVVDGFSTFVLTWGENNEYSSTIVYGTVNSEGAFVPFESADMDPILDTSANNVSIANTFAGYTYRDAAYCAPGEAFDDGVSILAELDKTSSGTWQYTIPANDDAGTSEQHKDIVNGSTIYAVYYIPTDPPPSGSGSSTVPSPTGTKTVTINDDGTATIQLDITGHSIKDDESHYANVMIIFDATQSMSGNKWTNAKTAARTLVNTLTTGENSGNSGKIDFCFISFGRAATITGWGNNAVSGTNGQWTKNESSVLTAINNLGMVSTSGTNWESGMRAGVAALGNMPDNDPLYIIFLTDGDPNTYYTNENSTNYDNSGTAPGYQNSSTTSANRSKDEAKTLAAAGSLYGIYCFSGNTADTGSASYRRLDDVIRGEGQGGKETIAATASNITEKFQKIAQTIIEFLGATNVSADDGIPQLASASADVSGTAGGYEYYISSDGTNYTTWADAPGASFSEDNGVTWDLSAAGVVDEGKYYRIKFKVWPSQEAYDIIANLNNGLIEYDDLDEDVKEQIDEHNTNPKTYSLKTNTHYNLNYSFAGTNYQDQITDYEQGELPLVSHTMVVKKEWDDSINPRNRTDKVDFYLLVDGQYYQNDGTLANTKTNAYKLETEEEEWTDSVKIAPGFAEVENGKLVVYETGHKYVLEEIPSEDPDYEGYSQDFTSQTVRPMVIGGELTYLVLVDEPHYPAPAGATTYTIGEGENAETYYVQEVAEDADGVLTGTNHKTPELDITKKIDASQSDKTEAQLNNEEFTYEVTFKVPTGGDVTGINYWIYEKNDSGWTLPEYDSNGLGAAYAPYGHTDGAKYSGSKTELHFEPGQSSYTATVIIKRTQVVRFTNLPAGTEYTIIETQANGQALSSQGYTVKEANSTNGTASKTTIDKDTIKGTAESLNTRYYNQYENKLQAVDAELKVTKALEGYEWSAGDSSYEFTLTATGNAPLPYKNVSTGNKVTVSSASELTKTFGSIRFTAAGTYTYTITETDGQNPAIVYGGPATVTVTVVKNDDGTLEVSDITGTGTEVSTAFTAASSGNDASANTTITNKWAKTSIDATKTWADASVVAALKIKQIALKLQQQNADGTWSDVTGQTDVRVSVGQDGKWTYTFKDLPKYTTGGAAIVYKVVETAIYAENNEGELVNIKNELGLDEDAFTASEGTSANNYTVNNTRNKGYLKLTKSLANGSEPVTIPDSTEFTITGPADFGTNGSMTVTYADIKNGNYVIEVPTGTYKVVEDTDSAAVTGYTLAATTYSPQTVVVKTTNTQQAPAALGVVNKYTRNTYSAKVTKTFSGNDGNLPENFKVTIKYYDSNNELQTVEKTLAQADEGTTYSWTINGVLYGTTFSAEESGETITGYTLGDDAVKSGSKTIGTNAAQNVVALSNPYTRNTYSAKVTKTFSGNDGNLPKNFKVTIKYYDKDNKLKTVEKTLAQADEGTTYSWTIDGVLYNTVFSAEESGETIEGYTLSDTSVKSGSKTIGTNAAQNVVALSNVYKHTSVEVTKKWVDNNNAEGNRPDSITVKLYRSDSTEPYKTAILTAADGWKYTWEPLETGYTYRVDEVAVAGYKKSVPATLSGNEEDGYTIEITNTYEPPKKEVSGTHTTETETTTIIDGSEVFEGDELTYKITYTNTTDEELTIKVDDSIPNYTTYKDGSDDVSGASNTNFHLNTESTDGKVSALHWTNIKVAAGKTVIVSFKVTVDKVTGEPINNKAKVEDGNKYETNETSNPTGTPPVKDVFSSSSSDSIDGKAVKKDDVLTYKITYKNTTGKTVDTLTFTDKIPTNSEYEENSAYIVGDESNVGVLNDAGDTLTWTVEGVAKGETVVATFKVKVKANNGTSVDNTSTVTAGKNEYETNTTHNPTPKDPEKEVWRVSAPEFNIDGKAVLIGETLTYAITYKNTTGVKAEVTITDNIPAHTSYVDGSASHNGSFSEGKVTWNMTLENNQEVTVTFNVIVGSDVSGELLINTGKVYDATNDFNLESEPVENPTPRKLVIQKDLSNFVDHGNDETATFTFRITGQSEAYGGLYSTVRAVEFTGKDTKTITVSGIPADIQGLKVEEVDAGNYSTTDPDDVTQQPTLNEQTGVYEVSFENTYDDTNYKTGTINKYKRTEKGKYVVDKGDSPGDGSGEN